MEDNETQQCDFCQEVLYNVDDIANHLVLYHGNEKENPVQNEQILTSARQNKVKISAKNEDRSKEEEVTKVENEAVKNMLENV